ncbi:MAG: Rrf2 family transcriptional regulator [Bryobacterales bacterium]|nr:Rrf2 family transcriptional regulator [Bryobacterales bacterium]
MLYSRSAEYAIRALVCLARAPQGKYSMARVIADAEQIPGHFLAKILQELTRKGLLRSSKGPTGGFCLRVPAHEIRLIELVEMIDGRALADAGGRIPWTLDGWKPLHSRIMESLGRWTIADLARAVADQERAVGGARRTTRPQSRKD